MPEHDIIVIGASAGGVEALTAITRTLPSSLAAAVLVVLHIPPQSPSLLPTILSRNGPLEAVHAENGMMIRRGHIYVAPPDQHMLVEQGKVHVGTGAELGVMGTLVVARGAKENRHRPAVDPLFRSAAQAYGSRVVGMVLTGGLDDGTAGLLAVKRGGGIAVVQDPDEALFPGMPLSALHHVEVDYTLPVASIGPLLARLASEQVTEEGGTQMSDDLEKETKVVQIDTSLMQDSEQNGKHSAFSCPECGGVLWEIQDGNLLRFRCRVGHAFSIESMFAEQSQALETALWVALKTLQESADLSRRMAQQAYDRGHEWLAKRYEERLRMADERITLIKRVLIKSETI